MAMDEKCQNFFGRWTQGKHGWVPIALLLALFSSTAGAQADSNAKPATHLDSEVFELGLFTGVLNVGDFGSEWALGVSGTFQASEDFFLQYNYLQADVGLSSFEESQGRYFSGSDRRFVHYDLLVGYNIFQAEVYPSVGRANLSSFYLVGGVGETRFGGEERFTFTAGLGYQVALSRDVILHTDYRSYIYDSSLIRSRERSTESSQFSLGLKYLF